MSSPGSRAAFEPVGEKKISLGGASPVAWLRFRLDSGSDPETQWVLEVQPSFAIILDKLDLYLPRPGRGYDAFGAGARVAERRGEHRSPNFVFELPRAALRGEYCYLRLQSSMAVELRAAAWPVLSLWRRDAIYCIAYSLIYGVLIGMLLYNFFLFFALKDRAYLYYVFYIGTSLLWQFWVQGHAKALLGVHPGLDLALMWVFVGNTIFWGAAVSPSRSWASRSSTSPSGR